MLEVQASLYHYYLSNLTRLIALIRAHSPLKLTSCHQHKQIKEGIKNQTNEIISKLTFDLTTSGGKNWEMVAAARLGLQQQPLCTTTSHDNNCGHNLTISNVTQSGSPRVLIEFLNFSSLC